MKMNVIVKKVRVLAKEATPSADGKATYYKLAVLTGSECGNVSCSKDVYDLVELEKTYDLSAVYNDAYKSLKFEQVVAVPPAGK